MGIFQRGFRRGTSSFPKLSSDSLKKKDSNPSPRLSPIESPSNLAPAESPAHEDVPIWNILPSYQLYESTFSKVMDPSIDEPNSEPPLYEVSPVASPSSEGGPDYFATQTNSAGLISTLQTPEPRWENSILANAHQMKHVDEFDKSVADMLKIDIYLTRRPGASGQIPEFYSPREIEFSQGDSIHGHVIVVNTCDKPLSFDMFSVVFEGRMSVNSNEAGSGVRPLLFYKFLNMFDYNASWTPVFFEEKLKDSCDYVDPVDGTTLQFPYKRELQPGIAYKKFFNFTIPTKLLDCACETHEIPQHCVLLPSIGLDKSVFLQRLRKLREAPSKAEIPLYSNSTKSSNHNSSAHGATSKKIEPNIITRDYGFPDTSISYSVETKVVGRRSVYEKYKNEKTEEFIVVKEASLPLRIIPKNISSTEYEDDGLIAEKHYASFLRTVEKCLKIGHRLEEGAPSESLSRQPSTAKQIYQAHSPSDKNAENGCNFRVHYPYRKKHLAHPVKIVGLLDAVIPKREHVIRYQTPYIFKPLSDIRTDISGMLQIPITFEYFNTDPDSKLVRPPEIRGVNAKIVVCTVRSKKYPIPIELTQEMKFRNIIGGNDGVEKYVIAPFKAHSEEFKRLIGLYGARALGISSQLLMDIKSLANMDAKSANLKVENVTFETEGGLGHWKELPNEKKAVKQMIVNADITSLFVRDSKRPLEDKLQGALTLVPSFQSCIMCRFYYLLIDIKLGNGETMPLKVPFRIVR